jgi:hypothetical protein
MMSSDLMDTHESVMKEKMMILSKRMSDYAKKAYKEVKDSSKVAVDIISCNVLSCLYCA